MLGAVLCVLGGKAGQGLGCELHPLCRAVSCHSFYRQIVALQASLVSNNNRINSVGGVGVGVDADADAQLSRLREEMQREADAHVAILRSKMAEQVQ